MSWNEKFKEPQRYPHREPHRPRYILIIMTNTMNFEHCYAPFIDMFQQADTIVMKRIVLARTRVEYLHREIQAGLASSETGSVRYQWYNTILYALCVRIAAAIYNGMNRRDSNENDEDQNGEGGNDDEDDTCSQQEKDKENTGNDGLASEEQGHAENLDHE
ncbi:hypothetical protein QBC35DRAFT_454882 [Podospora australis]|uniref:Uncharacterized protein n=1 Tax=Podospora australis TaxID=1536484 RepID=A0AAN6WR00_9PEZI|nr:hypothetical protein QBC35DRAFT_454882 [Podospora australis]